MTPRTPRNNIAYDAAGRESQLTYPDGTVVQRTFTARSQLETVSLTEPGSNTAQSVSTFEYDAGRRETSRTYGNGITTTRTYRADNLVTAITAPSVESLTYTYDVNKNPTSEARSGVMAPYSWATDINGTPGFDAQNRLTNWTRSNGDSQSWQLSAVNDWQTFTNNGVQQQRTHGPTHEIASIDNTPLQHDSRGNLTQDNRGTSMTYDADNMLAVFNANGVEGLRNANYTYDALGRRISKTVASATENDPATTTIFVLANQQVIAEYQSTGTAQPTLASRTAYGTYVDEPLILLSNLQSQICYYHSNRQYSIYDLTDTTGTVLDRIAYTPYGEHYCFTLAGAPRGGISEAGNSTLYTGRIADRESGLHYFRARYMSSQIGRFLSRDPLEFLDGTASYGFLQSLALRLTDPLGLMTIPTADMTPFEFSDPSDYSPISISIDGGATINSPTSDSLTWGDFTGAVPIGSPFGAETSAQIFVGRPQAMISGCKALKPSDCENEFRLDKPVSFDGTAGGPTSKKVTKTQCGKCSDCFRCQVDVSVTVRAIFNKKRSWVKAQHSNNPALLEHERRHLRLEEAAACELRKKDPGPQFANSCDRASAIDLARIQWWNSFNASFNAQKNRASQLQDDYDNETQHGLDPVKQAEWEAKIDLMLKNCALK